MDSYRVEKQAAIATQLEDNDAEIGPVPTSAGGGRPEPELDRLSNIVAVFSDNDQFKRWRGETVFALTYS
jgi:type I restriction enzyme R subunit